MSSNIKVTLPESFSPDERAYFYQRLGTLNYFLLPGTQVNLQVDESTDEADKKKYNLEINFNKTIVKTSMSSDNYHTAIKRMMDNLQGKFTEILETVNKKEKKAKASEEEKSKEEDSEKIIH